jgi:hypothetical protein
MPMRRWAESGPPFGLLDDTLPSDASATGTATAHSSTTKLPAWPPSVLARACRRCRGRLLLQQLAGADQPLIDLVAAHP